jgi:transposase
MSTVGTPTAQHVDAITPSIDHFKSGRDFAAWLGLVLHQHSTCGVVDLGASDKKTGLSGYSACED